MVTRQNLYRYCVYLTIGISLLSIFFLQETSAAEKTLLLWRERTYVKDADVVLEKQIDEWATQNNCKVVTETYTFDQKATKFTTAIENKTLPDVAAFDALTPARLHAIGRLEDVTDVVLSIQKGLGKLAPNVDGNVKFGGKYYGVPHFGIPPVIHYRKDVLDKLGLKPPQSWEEMFEQAKKVKAAGIMNFPAGFPWNRTGDGQEPALAIFWNRGASWCDKNGYYKSINTPQGLEAVELMIKPYVDGTAAQDYLAWPGTGNNEAWTAGTICFTLNGPSIIWAMRNSKHPLLKDTGIMLMQGAVQPLTQLYSWGISADRGRQNIDLGKSLIRHIMAKNNSMEYMKASAQQAGIPYENLISSDYWADEYGKIFIETVKKAAPIGWPGPTTVAAAEVLTTNVLTDIAGRVIVDKISPKDALKEADDKIRIIYQRLKLVK